MSSSRIVCKLCEKYLMGLYNMDWEKSCKFPQNKFVRMVHKKYFFLIITLLYVIKISNVNLLLSFPNIPGLIKYNPEILGISIWPKSRISEKLLIVIEKKNPVTENWICFRFTCVMIITCNLRFCLADKEQFKENLKSIQSRVQVANWELTKL